MMLYSSFSSLALKRDSRLSTTSLWGRAAGSCWVRRCRRVRGKDDGEYLRVAATVLIAG